MSDIIIDKFNLWTNILEVYRMLPKFERDKTFMEICRPNRFEETCSRILEFFLSSDIHNFHGLFLNSIFTLIGKQDFANKTNLKDGIHVRTEERTDWTPYAKRIDIVVEGINFVLAIENKINAPLYNDLETYYNYLKNKYPCKEILCTVLSLRHLSLKEKKKSLNSGFCIIYYEELFYEIENRIESLGVDNNSKWYIILKDFIKTIRNKMDSYMTKEEQHFFLKNKSEIHDLIDRYENYKKHIWIEQNESIINLQNIISSRTKGEWAIYDGTDLYVILGELINGREDKRIGIESWYIENELGSKGAFQILISTWSENAWQLYKEKLVDACKETGISFLEKDLNNNRHYLSFAYLDNEPDGEIIVKKLTEAFHFLKKVFSEKCQTN